MKLYIRAKGILEDEGDVSYFGPFEESEIESFLNDTYADMLAAFNEVEAVLLSLAETCHMYINSKEYWIQQRDGVLDIDAGTQHDEVYSPSGEFLTYGRCDTCSAPCTRNGCEKTSTHIVALSG